MKKIGLLSILILCLVIGGVYATWDYANANATPNTPAPISFALERSDVDGAKGTIDADGPSTLAIHIDDTDKNHKADAVVGSGSYSVTFAPSDIATADVVQNGIKMEYALSIDWDITQFKYNDVQVFTSIDTSAQALNAGGAGFAATINGTDIDDLIVVNPDLELATINDYNAFSALLAEKTFTITIREKV